MVIENNINYKDVTKNWLEKAAPKNKRISHDKYFVDDNNIKHFGEEYDMANYILSIFGGDLHLVPRITDISNTWIKTSTPDFIWNGEKWDLKTPTVLGIFENSIERFVKNKKAKKQANNFIINFKNFNSVCNDDIVKLAEKTLKNPFRNWIRCIILIRNDKIIKIYLRN